MCIYEQCYASSLYAHTPVLFITVIGFVLGIWYISQFALSYLLLNGSLRLPQYLHFLHCRQYCIFELSVKISLSCRILSSPYAAGFSKIIFDRFQLWKEGLIAGFPCIAQHHVHPRGHSAFFEVLFGFWYGVPHLR